MCTNTPPPAPASLKWIRRDDDHRSAYACAPDSASIYPSLDVSPWPGDGGGWRITATTTDANATAILDHDPTDGECRAWLAHVETLSTQTRAEAARLFGARS